ncbi:MAG TPA: TetR/AcrR family transcriptional regulator [Pseudonocardia sp.]|jgi:AcrR family transcriptional regulator|uniref:TetR/AcrR family transcriptional regulator n=1 Tax=Pseudonocardia sp. TaxID=60912 RepID=UPI002BBF6829|nr:TetR/AcrR family transcriptional regulator [Pseudonocardia sp.]HTF49787.1 TetR/AcrR family transcriptional regulator [Pseudonocardia sp.]
MPRKAESSQTRPERRRAQTRAALVRAAQRLLAAGTPNVSVLEITNLADVGMGSFYNHFQSKEELYAAAIDASLEAHGNLLDALTADLDDPAERFARSFRLTGRLNKRYPELTQVMRNHGLAMIVADQGLAPRALRDITAATQAGRFHVRDPELAVVAAGGALLGLSQLLHSQPERDDAEATDLMAQDVLRMFGVPAEDAHEICTRPLPDLDTVIEKDPAA